MIKFKTKPEAMWVKASDSVFDPSEIGHFPSEEREKISFNIFPLTPKLARELRSKHSGVKGIGSSDEEITDSKAFQDDLLNHILLDWQGIIDEDGEPIECSKENKMALFDNGYPMLGACIITCARLLMSRFSQLKESEIKN